MKKGSVLRNLVLLAALLSVGVAQAEVVEPDTLTAGEVFADLPLNVLDMLNKSTRLDMLDFYQVDSIYQARNSMEGLSHLDKVNRDYISVTLTPVSTLEIRLLPVKKGNLFVTAYTIGDENQAYDTDLHFYNGSYQELPRDKYITIAQLDDFFNYPDKEIRGKVADLIPFPTVKYTLSPESDTVTAELTVGQFMSAEDYKSLTPYLKGKLKYIWNGKRFKLEK